MAKYESELQGAHADIIKAIMDGVTSGSMSASYESGSDFEVSDVKCSIRVFERYSMMGKNRVSMNVTVFSENNHSYISAITSGGSQAVFFKINTFGEDAFLDHLINCIRRYEI